MKRFFWIPFCLLLALFGAALLNAAVADGLVAGWCAELRFSIEHIRQMELPSIENIL